MPERNLRDTVMNYAAQKSALTRALNSHEPQRIVDACRKAVEEWCAPGNYWPDDWARWQCALDSVIYPPVDLRDLPLLDLLEAERDA